MNGGARVPSWQLRGSATDKWRRIGPLGVGSSLFFLLGFPWLRGGGLDKDDLLLPQVHFSISSLLLLESQKRVRPAALNSTMEGGFEGEKFGPNFFGRGAFGAGGPSQCHRFSLWPSTWECMEKAASVSAQRGSLEVFRAGPLSPPHQPPLCAWRFSFVRRRLP